MLSFGLWKYFILAPDCSSIWFLTVSYAALLCFFIWHLTILCCGLWQSCILVFDSSSLWPLIVLILAIDGSLFGLWRDGSLFLPYCSLFWPLMVVHSVISLSANSLFWPWPILFILTSDSSLFYLSCFFIQTSAGSLFWPPTIHYSALCNSSILASDYTLFWPFIFIFSGLRGFHSDLWRIFILFSDSSAFWSLTASAVVPL